jgi:hypothetical protein
VSADNDIDEMFRNVDDEFTSKGHSQKFLLMMKDNEALLFLGCKKEHNKLHVVHTLLQMKASNG